MCSLRFNLSHDTRYSSREKVIGTTFMAGKRSTTAFQSSEKL